MIHPIVSLVRNSQITKTIVVGLLAVSCLAASQCSLGDEPFQRVLRIGFLTCIIHEILEQVFGGHDFVVARG